MPDLLAVIPAAVPADEAGREYAVPAERPTGTLAAGKFRLHLLELLRRDDGLVGVLLQSRYFYNPLAQQKSVAEATLINETGLSLPLRDHHL